MLRQGRPRLPLGLLLLLLPACTAAVAGPPPPANAKEAPGAPPASWTDPRVLKELERSCAFDPDSLPPKEQAAWLGEMGPGDSSPLSCKGYFDQSCVYDPCFEEGEEVCKPRCNKDCQSCGKTCAGACEACKRGCKGAACTRACALGCATCRQTCVRKHDRCATGTCTEVYKQCRQKLKADWRNGGCAKVCEPYRACQGRCLKKHPDYDDAYQACDKACKPRTSCKLALCPGENGMGIDPEQDP